MLAGIQACSLHTRCSWIARPSKPWARLRRPSSRWRVTPLMSGGCSATHRRLPVTIPGGLLPGALLLDAVRPCAPAAWTPWTSGVQARKAAVSAWLQDAAHRGGGCFPARALPLPGIRTVRPGVSGAWRGQRDSRAARSRVSRAGTARHSATPGGPVGILCRIGIPFSQRLWQRVRSSSFRTRRFPRVDSFRGNA